MRGRQWGREKGGGKRPTEGDVWVHFASEQRRNATKTHQSQSGVSRPSLEDESEESDESDKSDPPARLQLLYAALVPAAVALRLGV